MKIKNILLLILNVVFMVIFPACSGSQEGAPQILDIVTDPASPVPVNTNVNVTAEVQGDIQSYQWTVDDGIVHKADNILRNLQISGFPDIAVTPAGTDNISEILDQTDIPYSSVTGSITENLSWLEQFDILFINSAESIDVTSADLMLRTWVEGGGALYLGGSGVDFIKTLWPDKITFPQPDPYVGSAGMGESSDLFIRDFSAKLSLSRTSGDIKFESEGWAPVISTGANVKTVYTADVNDLVNSSGITNLPAGHEFDNAPVALHFRYGDGLVVYSSINYIDQNTEIRRNLLRYLVFYTMTHPHRSDLHRLVSLGGWFVYADITNVIQDGKYNLYSLQFDALDDLFAGLHAFDGTFKLEAYDTGNSEDISGPVPISMSLSDASPGTWNFRTTCIDSDGHPFIPWNLTIATKANVKSIITDVPTVTWRTPSEPGTYLITLRATDYNGLWDEMILGVNVE